MNAKKRNYFPGYCNSYAIIYAMHKRKSIIIFAFTIPIVQFIRTIARKALVYQLYTVLDTELINGGIELNGEMTLGLYEYAVLNNFVSSRNEVDYEYLRVSHCVFERWYKLLNTGELSKRCVLS